MSNTEFRFMQDIILNCGPIVAFAAKYPALIPDLCKMKKHYREFEQLLFAMAHVECKLPANIFLECVDLFESRENAGSVDLFVHQHMSPMLTEIPIHRRVALKQMLMIEWTKRRIKNTEEKCKLPSCICILLHNSIFTLANVSKEHLQSLVKTSCKLPIDNFNQNDGDSITTEN